MKNSQNKAKSTKTSKKAVGDKTGSVAISISNTTRQPVPRLAFVAMARALLSPGYELSLVIINDKRALELNKAHRRKATAANVLSFPLDALHGEIFLNIDRAKREARDFGSSYRSHLGFLFIHGLLHLEGYDHGSTMERVERQARRRFKL